VCTYVYSDHTTHSFPYTTLFRSKTIIAAVRSNGVNSGQWIVDSKTGRRSLSTTHYPLPTQLPLFARPEENPALRDAVEFYRHRRSEEHTSELQSRVDLVCRLLLE